MDLRDAVERKHSAIGQEPHALPAESFGPVDAERVLALIGLNPRDPKAHAVVAVADRYGLDPVLGHIALISTSRMPYITRDGYLHIAHRSGKFDGMEVVDGPRRAGSEWYARVSVFRTDMSHAFTYPGRAELSRENGPEMCIARAERRALKRAFNITIPGDFAEDETDTRGTAAPSLRELLAPEQSQAGPGAAPPPVRPLRDAQRRAIFAGMADIGMTERDERLAFCARAIGRDIESSNELTEGEASVVLAVIAAHKERTTGNRPEVISEGTGNNDSTESGSDGANHPSDVEG